MKIYFLRHEKRPQEQTFEISLTEEGHQDAQKLIPLLNSLSIQEIYSSPFLRCLETLYPFCKNNNKNINIENSLYEFVTERLFTQSNYKQSLTSSQKSSYLVNNDYTSFFDIENLFFPQTEKLMEERARIFNCSIPKYTESAFACMAARRDSKEPTGAITSISFLFLIFFR